MTEKPKRKRSPALVRQFRWIRLGFSVVLYGLCLMPHVSKLHLLLFDMWLVVGGVVGAYLGFYKNLFFESDEALYTKLIRHGGGLLFWWMLFFSSWLMLTIPASLGIRLLIPDLQQEITVFSLPLTLDNIGFVIAASVSLLLVLNLQFIQLNQHTDAHSRKAKTSNDYEHLADTDDTSDEVDLRYLVAVDNQSQSENQA